MASALRDALDFLYGFGLFDVVLPFLLVFTIIFGILEKTKIFGTEGDDGKQSRKNINAMISFVVAFFVVAAGQVVEVIQNALPFIMLLLVFIIMFMILFGSTLKQGEMDLWAQFDKSKKFFGFALLIAIIAIALGAMGLLGSTIDWIVGLVGGQALSSIVLLILIAIAMWFVMRKEGDD